MRRTLAMPRWISVTTGALVVGVTAIAALAWICLFIGRGIVRA